jgi:hypothetical protein
MDKLLRFGAVCAALSGGLEVAAQAIPYVPDSAGLELLYGAIDLSFLFALVALVAMLAGRVSGWALGLLLVAMGGVASIVGPDRTAFGVDFYQAGSAIFVLALGLASPALAKQPGLRGSTWAWGAAALAALGAGLGGGAPAFVTASLLLALGFILAAPVLWRAGSSAA